MLPHQTFPTIQKQRALGLEMLVKIIALGWGGGLFFTSPVPSFRREFLFLLISEQELSLRFVFLLLEGAKSTRKIAALHHFGAQREGVDPKAALLFTRVLLSCSRAWPRE